MTDLCPGCAKFFLETPGALSKGAHGTPRAPRAAPSWTLGARFRRGALGWKSDWAIERLDEAAVEIRTRVRKDPVLAADGSVPLIEKLSLLGRAKN